jgi:hypothetical protein
MCEWVWILESLFGVGAGLAVLEEVVVGSAGAVVVEGPAVEGAMVTSEVIFRCKCRLRVAVFCRGGSLVVRVNDKS